MTTAETTVAIHRTTREKLRRIKKLRRWNIKDIIDLLADRELAAIKTEKNLNTPPGSSGTDGVSSPPLLAGHTAAGD